MKINFCLKEVDVLFDVFFHLIVKLLLGASLLIDGILEVVRCFFLLVISNAQFSPPFIHIVFC